MTLEVAFHSLNLSWDMPPSSVLFHVYCICLLNIGAITPTFCFYTLIVTLLWLGSGLKHTLTHALMVLWTLAKLVFLQVSWQLLSV